MLTLKFLKKHLKYDPETGKWERLRKCGTRYPPGSKVGSLIHDRAGIPYRVIGIGGRRYKNARLAVFYMRGKWPAGVVDHRDGDTLNDIWSNLRPCTRRQNSWNRRLNSDNKSGHKGVFWHAQAGRWGAAISVNKKRHYLGLFTDVALAALAYETAAKEHFGEFVRA